MAYVPPASSMTPEVGVIHPEYLRKLTTFFAASYTHPTLRVKTCRCKPCLDRGPSWFGG